MLCLFQRMKARAPHVTYAYIYACRDRDTTFVLWPYGALYVRACVRRGPAVLICIPGCGWGAGVGVGAEGTRITFVGKHVGAVAVSQDPQAGISESGLRVYST